MPANLLLLPLLAGYLFVHIGNRFRFRAQALDGYRLLIESAMAGVVLLGLSRVVTIALGVFFPGIHSFWHQYIVPDRNLPYLGTAVGSLILGVVLPALDNRRPRLGLGTRIARLLLLPRNMRPLRRLVLKIRAAYQENRRAALDSEIRLHGNGLTRLLHDAATFGTLILVTLANRKWYVGYVAEAVNLEPQEFCFRLLPVLSGYRDKDTLKLQRQVYYRPAYEDIRAVNGNLEVFVITLALKDVQDARIFDESIYEDRFAQPQ
ncbi:MAG TPA: hypothetical protein VG672_15095 [Bryobacteraceae bacterium]|nr:hypothetical protein [Bryobacteraceae bacterium]